MSEQIDLKYASRIRVIEAEMCRAVVRATLDIIEGGAILTHMSGGVFLGCSSDEERLLLQRLRAVRKRITGSDDPMDGNTLSPKMSHETPHSADGERFMSEPIDTSREAFGRLVMSTATNGERALVQSLTDLVLALLDERDARAVRVEDAESQVEHYREVSANCGRQLGEAYEAYDRLFEERLTVMGMLRRMDPMLPVSIVDAVRQLISACECYADAYGHADMRVGQEQEKREAAEKLLEEAAKFIESLTNHTYLFRTWDECLVSSTAAVNWLTRYAERATPSTEKEEGR